MFCAPFCQFWMRNVTQIPKKRQKIDETNGPLKLHTFVWSFFFRKKIFLDFFNGFVLTFNYLTPSFNKKIVMNTQDLALTQSVSFGSNETLFMKNCN